MKLDDTLATHAKALKNGAAPDLKLLRKGLSSRYRLTVMNTAKLIVPPWGTELEDAMESSFRRLLINPLKSDQACHGKMAILDALERCKSYRADLFLTAIRHIQLEPVWGEYEDTAGMIRSTAAACLAQIHHPEILNELAILLADDMPAPRLNAARLIPSAGIPGGGPLLRFKLLQGDTHAEVITACCTSLLALEGTEALDFVVKMLDSKKQEIAEAAAFGLGESRLEEALKPLQSAWATRPNAEWRLAIFSSLVLLRQRGAYDTLLTILLEESDTVAGDVVKTLTPVVEHDPKLAADLQRALEQVKTRERRMMILDLLERSNPT